MQTKPRGTHGLPGFLCHDAEITGAAPVLDEPSVPGFDKNLL